MQVISITKKWFVYPIAEFYVSLSNSDFATRCVVLVPYIISLLDVLILI